MDRPLSKYQYQASAIGSKNDIPPAILLCGYTPHAGFYVKIKYGNTRKWFFLSMQCQEYVFYFYLFNNKFIYNTACTTSLSYLYFFSISLYAKKFQVNNYEIVVNFLHISHNLTWYSAIVHKFTRIYPVCSTYELTKQFV